MAHQPRYVRTLRKRDLKELILWFIGCHRIIQAPEGPRTIKEEDSQASTGEILDFLKSDLRGRTRSEIPRRTLHNYLEELLKDERTIQSTKKGIYTPTENGWKKWVLINLLFRARNTLSTREPIGTFFSFGRDNAGKTECVDIVVRIQDPKLTKILENAVIEKRVSENETELGRMLSTVIMWYSTDIFSRINEIIDGKESVFLEILKRLPLDLE